MKHLVRITSCNGVVYEEQMTEGQITQFLRLIQFLRLTAARTSLGVAFGEWGITIIEAAEQTPGEHERTDITTPLLNEAEWAVFSHSRKSKGIA